MPTFKQLLLETFSILVPVMLIGLLIIHLLRENTPSFYNAHSTLMTTLLGVMGGLLGLVLNRIVRRWRERTS